VESLALIFHARRREARFMTPDKTTPAEAGAIVESKIQEA
jgi:hypothetical protein